MNEIRVENRVERSSDVHFATSRLCMGQILIVKQNYVVEQLNSKKER